jgi:DNA-binding MarR family transcriptional regulator
VVGTTRNSDVLWLNETEREVWLALVGAVIRLPQALDRQLRRDSQLTHFEYQIMAMLSDAPMRQMRMTALAELTEGSLPRLSQAVKRMQERGLLVRLVDPEDGRCTVVGLTKVGYAALVTAAPGHVETVRRLVFDALSTAQAQQLRRACMRIVAATEQDV